MFDGSHRTKRREINLAGRANRSNRSSTLHEARQQRLARAAAKAKTNAALILQKRWRGVRCRREVTIATKGEFDRINIELVGVVDGKNKEEFAEVLSSKEREVSRFASLLAFQLIPPLVVFFEANHNLVSMGISARNNSAIETCIRQDLLSLEYLLQCRYQTSEKSKCVSQVAARRLAFAILIVLRHSSLYRTQIEPDGENQRLARLLNYLLEVYFIPEGVWTKSSTSGWLINIFFCLSDACLCDKNTFPGGISSMDVDDEREEEIKNILFKWCCNVILHLAKLDKENEALDRQDRVGHQNALALMGSIICVMGMSQSSWPSSIQQQLEIMFHSLTQQIGDQKAIALASTEWSSIFVYFLSRGINALSKVSSKTKIFLKIGPDISETLKSLSLHSSLASPGLWLNAISYVITSREHILLDQILSYAESSPQNQYILTHSMPVIIQYALRQQQELAVLASFAAQGDEILNYVNNSFDSAAAGTLASAATSYDEDSESESEGEQLQQKLYEQQQQSNYPGRQSRVDLQTVTKLDTLYQTQLLQRKKCAIGKLQSNSSKMLRFVLATKIGGGTLLQQLGDTIFSSVAKEEVFHGLLSQSSAFSMHKQAQESYISSLATIISVCSGLKAGRNASSPLLAKLAFHEPFLNGLEDIAKKKESIITSSLLTSTSLSEAHLISLTAAYEAFSTFCDVSAHWNLAVDDDIFLQKYHGPHPVGITAPSTRYSAKELVVTLKTILNDLYWARPVISSDICSPQQPQHNEADASFRFQRARLLLSGTKLWNCLYDRWCRLYRTVTFCEEEAWWFPQLASRGQHDDNPIIHSQVTSVGGDDDVMEESSVEGDAAAAISATSNDRGMDALATSFRDPKMARILTCIPQALPFTRRVNLFQNLLESDKAKTQDESTAFRQMMMNWDSDGGDSYSGREKVTIHRDSLYIDSMKSLMPLGKKLRKKLQVTFVNQHGIEEAGIDGGGVQKEFFDDLIKDAFIPSQHKEASDTSTHSHPDFFVETSIETLQVNISLTGNEYLYHYEFLGRVLGKSMYESILVDPQFSLPFLNKILGKQNSLDDLKNLDPEYYKHLKSLRHMSANEISSLGLVFEITISAAERYSYSTIELIPGGRDVVVTKENVIQYIHLVSHQRMNVAGARQTAAFLHGFREIIPAPWVRLFSAYELQKLISGDDTVKGIDVAGMMAVMRYSGGYHPSQPIIHWLWEVVDEMTAEQQRKFLRFMTSCSRQPLLGFSSLVPAPCIQQTRLREDDYGNDVSDEFAIGNIRLPTSSTCMNLLKLPRYTTKQMLKEKLTYAIDSSAGFELS